MPSDATGARPVSVSRRLANGVDLMGLKGWLGEGRSGVHRKRGLSGSDVRAYELS